MILAQCIETFGVSYGLPVTLFLGGLVGGFTHCAGMCAPFVLAQTGGDLRLSRSKTLLIPYHLGRMTTYIGLAVAVNALVNVAFVFSDMKALIAAPILSLAAVIFLVSAFPKLANLFPWAVRLQYGAFAGWLSKFSSKLTQSPKTLPRYGLGVLLGFMPCGLVISALLATSVAPNIWSATGAMAAFTVGTMPALILVAFGGTFIKQRYPQIAGRLSQGAMVLSGVWLLALAGSMVF